MTRSRCFTIFDGRSLNSYRANRYAVIDKLGGKCVSCGYSDKRALQLDHIESTGTHVGVTQTELVKILYEKKPTDHLQVLCANCHAIKTFENKDYRTRIQRSKDLRREQREQREKAPETEGVCQNSNDSLQS